MGSGARVSPDLIFTVGGIIFAIGLLPAVLDSETRIPLKTSLPTCLVLFVYAGTFFEMGLPFSGVTSLVTASMWLFLVCARRTAR